MPDSPELPSARNTPPPTELKKEDIAYTPEGLRKMAYYLVQQAVKEEFGDGQILTMLTGFNAEQFALGLTDSILETGENLGALAYNIYTHPEETLLVLLRDLHALDKDPQVLVEAGLVVSDSITEWWEQTEKEKGGKASYDMGHLVGLVESRLFTRGVLTATDTPGRLEPAVGPKARTDLMSEMFTTSVVARIQKELPFAEGILRPLFEDMNRRMHETESPLLMDAFAETMKNLSLHEKHADLVPIKKSSIIFLRNQLVESVYSAPEFFSTKLKALDFLKTISALISATAQPGSLVGTLTSLNSEQILLYTKGKLEEGARQKAAAALKGIGESIAAQKTPGRELLVAFTDVLINNHFA